MHNNRKQCGLRARTSLRADTVAVVMQNMREMILYLGREIEATFRSLKRFQEWVSKQDNVTSGPFMNLQPGPTSLSA